MSPQKGSTELVGAVLISARLSEIEVSDSGERGDAGLSLRDIAAGLNDTGVPSKRGGSWHPQTVARVLQTTDGNQIVHQK